MAVDFPNLVQPGATFQISVRAVYSDKLLADVGIWDTATGLIVQSMTLISQFLGPGNVSFTLTLTAPMVLGIWHLTVVNRVWWQNAWYEDPIGGRSDIAVNISDCVSLGISSIGASAQASVDNQTYRISNGSSTSIILQPGSHWLEVQNIIPQNPRVRFVFIGWSDGVASNPRILTLKSSLNISAIYQTEYYLSVQSTMGPVAGQGWYDNGTQATLAVTPSLIVPTSSGVGQGFRFSEWSGDINSTSNPLTLTMDGPKQVTVNWEDTGPVIETQTTTELFLLGSLVLFGMLVVRSRRRGRSKTTRRVVGGGVVVLVLILLATSFLLPAAHAQPLPQPRAESVRVGDAEWYYWGRAGSDTCLIWLGGGVPEQSEPGSYGYFINPFDYESFGTIRFLQDLARFYCVIALKQGAVQGYDPTANRTIYQELFQPQTSTVEGLHRWITQQGYSHTFVVGYSVGGQAAASDLTLSHPENWTSQDGLILITVPFSQDLIRNARELRANLFIIYGGNLPDYEATGIAFYNSTQSEGPYGSEYIHKEFHLIDDVGHEPWTIRATGAYDTRALNLIIGFIERSKILQVAAGFQNASNNVTTNRPYRINSARTPVARVNQAFSIECNVTQPQTHSQPAMLAAYVAGTNQIITEATLARANSSLLDLTVPPFANATQLTLAIGVFENSDGRWLSTSNMLEVELIVTDLVRLTVETGYAGLNFTLDGAQYVTNSSGLTQLQVPIGTHSIHVQSLVYTGNYSRLRFIAWEDGSNQASRQIDVEGDSIVAVQYVQQYLLQVDSSYGAVSGQGWYDVNSTAVVWVNPPMVASPSFIFSHWTGATNQSETRTHLLVNSPGELSAVWEPMTSSQINPVYSDPWFISSLVCFVILLMLNLRPRSTHSADRARSPQRAS